MDGPRESFLRDSFYNTCVTKKMRNKSIAVTAFESNGMFAHLYACIIFQNIFLSLRCCFTKQILYLPLLCTYRKDFLSVSHKGNTWDIHRSKGHLVNEDDSSLNMGDSSLVSSESLCTGGDGAWRNPRNPRCTCIICQTVSFSRSHWSRIRCGGA